MEWEASSDDFSNKTKLVCLKEMRQNKQKTQETGGRSTLGTFLARQRKAEYGYGRACRWFMMSQDQAEGHREKRVTRRGRWELLRSFE